MPTARTLALVVEKIRKTQEELLDYLLGLYPEEIIMISGVRGFFKGKDDAQIYLYIKTNIFPHKSQIMKKDLNFFKENKMVVFKGLPENYINIYADMIINTPEDSIDTIWNFFSVLVQIYELSIKHKKNK
jgi:hypothetical protein